MRIAEDRKYISLALAIGIAIRSVPNLLTPYPIGYDTIYYVTQILDWRAYLSNPNIIFQTPLHLVILSPIYVATGLGPFTILRTAQPLLYGLLTTAFYYVARRIIRWSPRWALLAAIVFSLQTVTLRISWDLLRNELGLAILLYSLVALEDLDKRPLLFTALSTLTVLSHQFASVILLVIITGLTICHLYKRGISPAGRIVLSSIPAALLFVGVLGYPAGFQIIPSSPNTSIFPKTFSVFTRPHTFPFVNYLAGEGFIDYSGSHMNLLVDFISLYAASYLPLLPLVVLGLKELREPKIDLWAGFCTAASLMAIVTPRFALTHWERWMMMLIIPYTLYASKGIMTLYSITIHQKRMPRVSRKVLVIATYSLYASIALLYVTSPSTNPISPYTLLWPSTKYSPATLLRQGTPLEDIPRIEQALKWLDTNREGDSCLLARETFVNWAKIHLKNDATIIDYWVKDVSIGLEYAKTLKYEKIYWIWWENDIGLKWYGQQIPSDFKPIYKTGNIVIYKCANLGSGRSKVDDH